MALGSRLQSIEQIQEEIKRLKREIARELGMRIIIID